MGISSREKINICQNCKSSNTYSLIDKTIVCRKCGYRHNTEIKGGKTR